MCIDINLWKEVLVDPVKTFKAQEKKANLKDAVIQIIVAGIVAGFFNGISVAFGLSTAGTFMGAPMIGTGLGAIGFLSALIMTPIMFVIGWFIISAIFYVLALLFGGKGKFEPHMYLLAIFNAPLAIIISVLYLIPLAGGILGFLVGIYGLYLLTLALKQVHKLSTGKAVLVWLIPVVVIGILVALVLLAAFAVTGTAMNYRVPY